MKQPVHTNYFVQGMDVLLCEECTLQRFYPLIPYKKQLIEGLLAMHCYTTVECMALTDADWIRAGLPDEEKAALMRRFLHLYDYKGKGIKDIPDAANKTEAELRGWLELMRLPGVKAIRAELYYRCGFSGLKAVAAADAEEMRTCIAEKIAQQGWNVSVPLPKELRTQIAVAKVFTQFAVNEQEKENENNAHAEL